MGEAFLPDPGMDPETEALELTRRVLGAIPEGVDPATAGLALIGAGVLLLAEEGDGETAERVAGAVAHGRSLEDWSL
jgi:hypothetical protein